MGKKLYYADELKTEIKSVLSDEIGTIVYDANPAFEGMSADRKLYTMEGMYMLAAAIEEALKDKEEEE